MDNDDGDDAYVDAEEDVVVGPEATTVDPGALKK